jgi:head-tail adaptor
MLGPRLRHRGNIEQEIEQVTEAGEPAGKLWVVLYPDVPAELVPLSGREFMAANAEQKEVTTRGTIRQLPTTIDESTRFVHTCEECDGLAHNIVAVLPDPTYARHLTLMLAAGVRYTPPATEVEVGGGNANTTEDAFVGGGGA